MKKEITTFSDVTNAFNLLVFAEIIFLIRFLSLFNIVVFVSACLIFYTIFFVFKSKYSQKLLQVKKLEGICGVVHIVTGALVFSFWDDRSIKAKLLIFVCIMACFIIAVVIIDRYYVRLHVYKKPPMSQEKFAFMYCCSIIVTFLLVRYTRISGNDISRELLFIGVTYISFVYITDYLRANRIEHGNDK